MSSSASWIDEVAWLVKEFLHLRLGHPHFLAVVGVFNAVDKEPPSELVVGFKEIGRVEGWRSQ